MHLIRRLRVTFLSRHYHIKKHITISANQTTENYRLINMEVEIIFCGFFLLLANGARIQRNVEDDCAHPPENTESVMCCEMPKRHLLGKIRDSVRFCGEKFRENNTDADSQSPSDTSDDGQGHRKRYSFRRSFQDGCFMECLFEREGFIVDNTINKEALLERVKASQEGDEWQATALAAVEQCVTDNIEVSANETCKSGAAEIVRCAFKHMFLECPEWLEDNEYCTSVKEFYVRCPNGPPPHVPFKHHHRHHHHHHQSDKSEASENETEKPE